MKNIKAVIFDLDGTLIDTEKIYRQLWPRSIADMGYELTDEMYLSLRSLGRPFAPERFKQWYGAEFDYDEARRIRKVYFDSYIAEYGIERKPGVEELISYLHNKGIVTAIATATDPIRAKEYMDITGLSGLISKVISATMVPEGKPSPDIYQYACKELGFNPDECIAVEDAPNGIRSAYSAGLGVIMVPDLTQPDEVIQRMLSACVPSLTDIIDIIE